MLLHQLSLLRQTSLLHQRQLWKLLRHRWSLGCYLFVLACDCDACLAASLSTYFCIRGFSINCSRSGKLDILPPVVLQGIISLNKSRVLDALTRFFFSILSHITIAEVDRSATAPIIVTSCISKVELGWRGDTPKWKGENEAQLNRWM